MHENYSINYRGTEFNNIGLIRVSKPIAFNDKVDKIELQTEEFNEDGVSATLTGWGFTKVKLLNLQDKHYDYLNKVFSYNHSIIVGIITRFARNNIKNLQSKAMQ